MPAYNRADTIARALRSIAGQTVQPLEVIVIDDCSTDDTVQIARDLGARVLTSEVNAGSGPARNRGIDVARGEWVAFLDSDDEWTADHLQRLLEGGRDRVLIAASGVTSGGKVMGNPLTNTIFLNTRIVLETSELVVTSGCLARRDALMKAGLFRPLRRAQDLDMWCRLLQQGVGEVRPDRTVVYHEHSGQASVDTDLMYSCFTQIVDYSSKQDWYRGNRDYARIFARIHWDAMRHAVRQRRISTFVREAAWLLSHPQAVPAVVTLLRIRVARRRLGTVAIPVTSGIHTD